jgi:hypothetical protein
MPTSFRTGRGLRDAYAARRDGDGTKAAGVANIVEGCARDSEADYLHFLAIANASSRELEYVHHQPLSSRWARR